MALPLRLLGPLDVDALEVALTDLVRRHGILRSAYPEIDGLRRLIGRAATLEILLEGRVFGAGEAKDKGLVNRVVPDGEVETEAYATAERIAEGAPLVARWHKRFLERLDDPKRQGHEGLDDDGGRHGDQEYPHLHEVAAGA